MSKLLIEILKRAWKFSPRRGGPAQKPREARKKADEQGSSSKSKEECVGNCISNGERKSADIKSNDKLERQMKQRGWTREQIEEAIKSGEKFTAKNMQTGGAATRYVHPKTGQSVVIDDATGGVIHVGGPGFVY